MKKILVRLGIALVVLVGILVYVFPQVLFLFPFTQKWALQREGSQVATFYFKNEAKDSLWMKGVIYSNTLEDLKAVLNKHPEVTTLVMEEVPGSIDDEINLLASRVLRNRDVNTYIPKDGWVASGGTDMFLAGTERAIHPTARLGVHSWAGMEKVATDYPKDAEEHKKYLAYYKEMQIPSRFYWYTLEAAPADSIHWMTPVEIHEYKVVTPELSWNSLLDLQKVLASDAYAGRGTGANKLAQDLIENHLRGLGLQVATQEFSFEDERTGKKQSGKNILGTIQGTKYPSSYIVVGAHYDHMGIVGDTIYNGADDNASGTAAVLELARFFSKNPPEHSIIFAAFDAEELGLWGSKHFVKHPPVAENQLNLMLNFDMISRNDQNEIYVVGTHQYPKYRPILEEISKNFTELKVSFGHDDPNDQTKDYWMQSSDNGPFFAMGIPSLTFSEEDHADYHQPTDDIQNTHPVYYKNVVALIARTLVAIDQLNPL